MRKFLTKLNDAETAQKLSRSQNPILRVLVFIGKPLYYFLVLLTVALYFTCSRFKRLTARLHTKIKLLLYRSSRKIKLLITPVKKSIQVYPSQKLKIPTIPILFFKAFKKIISRLLIFTFKIITLLIGLLGKSFIYFITTPFSIFKFVYNKILKPLTKVLPLELKPPTQKPSKKYKYKKPAVSFRLLIFTIFFFAFFVTPITILKSITRNLPSPNELKERKVNLSTKIYDRNGILLYTIFKDENRTLVSIDDIPLHVKLATLAAEDAEFYNHPGFSLRGILRAAIRNLKEDDLEGGSTITQQLVKNTLLTPERTYRRKIREIILAIRVEQEFSKDEILEMYLNEVSYGGVAYGIQEASKIYFGKDIDRLTLGEAALLAGLPQSPTKYSPFGSNPELSFGRQKEVLWLMQVNGYIPEKQRLQAEEEKINFSQTRFSIRAPHFVAYVRELLEEKYGAGIVEKGGLSVTTSLDFGIQQQMEEIVRTEISSLEGLNVGNGALIVLNPKNGEIMAMVGSSDYFDIENQGNVNVTTSLRQPGSSIKIVNYAYALSNGYTAASVLEDSPITYEIEGQKPYTPKNYDNRFRGNLTLRSAFSESRNVPAVKTLESYGVINMIKMGRTMGITTWTDPDNYGLSLTLGGGEVKLIDLARVYATVANEGKRPPLTPILSINNHSGDILDDRICIQSDETQNHEDLLTENHDEKSLIGKSHASTSSANIINVEFFDNCEAKQILDPRVAFILTDILKDNEARAPAFGRNSQLVVPEHSEVAVKTGTSNNLRDNLTVGYNQDYLVAVWVGNNDNSQMSRVASGLTGASSIWNKAMQTLLADKESNLWEAPQGLIKLPICTYTGTLSCEGCPIKMEWFLVENAPDKHCSPEWFEEQKEEKENSGTEIIRIKRQNTRNQ